MKSRAKHCIVILFSFLFAYQGFAIDVQKSFSDAKENFDAKDYSEAISIYQDLLSEGIISASVYYNLGNTYYKNDELANAILYFEKAKKISPTDEEVLTNLDLAYQKTRDKTKLNNAYSGQNWLSVFAYNKPQNFWAIFSVVFSVLACVGFVLYLILTKNALKKIFFVSGSVSIIIVALSCFLAYKHKNYISNTKEAIIFTPFLEVKKGPANNSGKAFNLHEGTKIKVLKTTEHWIEISPGKDNVGWVKRKDLRFI